VAGVPDLKRSPKMSDEILEKRLERSERTVATCLCTVPALFGAQCLTVSLAVPVFEEMFTGFGSELPVLTTFVFGARAVWILLALGLPSVALFLARKKKATHAVVFATIAGIVLFFVAQVVTVAAFLPVFGLANAVGGNQ
jgi:riboflavin transporter FmnP